MTGRVTSVAHARAKNPFPWRYTSDSRGLMRVLDATGAEVAMFDLLDLAVIVTTAVAQGAPAPVAPQG